MRYLKLLGIFGKNSVMRELEYRANFAAQSALGFVFAAVTLIGVTVIFSQTSSLGGWSYAQALVIVGMFTLVDGVIHMVMEPNVKDVIEMVRDGKLDFVLVKPVNSQFMATLRRFRLSGVADLAVGVVIISIALSRLNYTPDLGSLAAFGIMLVVAILIVYSIWVAIATTSFWFVKVNNLSELFRAVFDTARFPVSTFNGLLRLTLTFIVPVAFITTFPAQAMLGALDPAILLLALVVGGVMFFGSAAFWRYAIRNYSSASS